MDAVERAMARIPRAAFLPTESVARAGEDLPCPIGFGQTNSQPRTVADMLRLLEVRTGQSVLDVGSGSGWTTALLAELTGPQGRVRGVERVPELVDRSRAALAPFGQAWASIVPAQEGVLGNPGEGPYARILVSAQARRLPRALVEQLDDGGIMVIPVAGEMLRVVRRRDGESLRPGARLRPVPQELADLGDDLQVSMHGRYRFVPLL